MATLVFCPLDTLFFRDGRPYNQGDPGQVGAASVFPPHPPTIVGAVRATLARAMGWPGTPWDADVLGSGVDWQAGDAALGRMRFAGPYVLRDGKPLFPAPLNLVAGNDETGADLITYLAPSRKALDTDLGATRLPASVVHGQGFKTLEGFWLDAAAMTQALGGSCLNPDCAVPRSCIWQPEPRVGIQRDTVRRTTAERALYAAEHARPAQKVALAIEVAGLPDRSFCGNLAPLGGEGRSAWIEWGDRKVDLPVAPALHPDKDGVLRYTVILIAPADLGDDWPSPMGRLNGSTGDALPGHIVSACTGRSIAVGGWDGLANRPLPLRPLIPTGSVWFLEAQADEAAAAAGWHGRAIGRATGWGFGRVLIGRWVPAGEET